MTSSLPPATVCAAIAAARADERKKCIAFLHREADRRAEMSGPEAEVFASDSASFATAAGLLAVWAAVVVTNDLAAGPGDEGADVEAEIRGDERKKCAAVLRDRAATMRRRGETTAAITASWLANEIDPLGPVMGAPAAGGTT